MLSTAYSCAILALFVVSTVTQQVPLVLTVRFPWLQRFASIGDSYSAGLGAGKRIDWACSRYASSYPSILHSSLLEENSDLTHQFLACSGATTTEILTKQVPALADNLDLLTISAGGNDIGLTPILSNCVYQFYASGDDACQKSMDQAKKLIANETQLYSDMTRLIGAARPKMNSDTGVIYYTGYSTFFGADDTTCDNVTWAVWRDVERNKQYLKLSMRKDLNYMVRSVNAIIRKAVVAAGKGVRFIDYDPRIEAARGRYCEANVVEPDPNRDSLVFYEWNTVDQGENRTQLQNYTGDGVPPGSFEAGIADQINKTLQQHPGWCFDPDKGFVNKTRGDVEEDGIIGDVIHWLLPDSYKRVFHLRPGGHRIIAKMVLEDLEKHEVGGSAGKDEVLEL